MLDWLQSPERRRRTRVGLNKHETMHALQRAVFLHRGGDLRDRRIEDQCHRASGLTLLCAAIVYWNAVDLGDLYRSMQGRNLPLDANLLMHVSPIAWEHINLTGDYIWPKEFVTGIRGGHNPFDTAAREEG